MPLRINGSQTIFASIDPVSNILELWYWDNDKGVKTNLTGSVSLQGVGSGRRLHFAVAVSPTRLTTFIDGKLVMDLNDSRLPRPRAFYDRSAAR